MFSCCCVDETTNADDVEALSQIRPVSHSINVYNQDCEPIIHALAAIDRVHVDGVLPNINAFRQYLTKGDGFYGRDGKIPGNIEIGYHAKWPHFTAVHEVGHFLDHQAIGNEGFYASYQHPALQAWRLAVRSSEAYRIIVSRKRTPTVTVVLPDGTSKSGSLDPADIAYYCRRKELFARCYSQYIAIKSQDNILIQQLNDIRVHIKQQVYPDQWSEHDFEPIYDALDALFVAKGWLI